MSKETFFIVEIESETWLAPWDGDPGRTLVKKYAKVFGSKSSATKDLEKAQSIPFRNGFPNAKIEKLDV